ncbi:hypothetical protein SDRG_16248 [Saprolegnia diclina VS20]|uniref:Choloylglycine hydrolase/NAAA C-terminal domain-containing protein n=1 Tax=Saprolegnia diclina (strain VS20) TaxID=1156394 RepID=T0PXV7_SAPDV|nr:hypothetical protein SDRG_16248 [Saprolegnia diclina VS20]EQC25875.1 hypothetical protein SDRG_16248 [Saprolegnia diclina VS20]|eukprot:XP_008620671.1 hypothetical protein SDRG_16248 [Saprolegnia diclina VS20]
MRLAVFALVVSLSHASIDVVVQSSSLVSARTFPIDLESTTIEIVPRGERLRDATFAWTSQYGYVALHAHNTILDGINEAGLSAALLDWGTSIPVPGGADGRPVITALVPFVLSNFGSLDDVQAGLAHVRLRPMAQHAWRLTVHDGKGHSLILNATNHVLDAPRVVQAVGDAKTTQSLRQHDATRLVRVGAADASAATGVPSAVAGAIARFDATYTIQASAQSLLVRDHDAKTLYLKNMASPSVVHQIPFDADLVDRTTLQLADDTALLAVNSWTNVILGWVLLLLCIALSIASAQAFMRRQGYHHLQLIHK